MPQKKVWNNTCMCLVSIQNLTLRRSFTVTNVHNLYIRRDTFIQFKSIKTFSVLLTIICFARVCVIRIADIKSHLSLLIIFTVIRITDIKCDPALLRGSLGLSRSALIVSWHCRCRCIICSRFQDRTLGLFELSFFHQGALRRAGRLDIS